MDFDTISHLFSASSRRKPGYFKWLTTLLVLALTATSLQASPDFRMKGWATSGKGTTGGGGGETVIVSTPGELIHQIYRSEPVIILVQGTIDLGQNFPEYKSNGRYYVESNKSIIGLGSNAGIRNGEFRLAGVSNIIIRNLTFRKAPDTSIAITHESTHVWIDHNDFADSPDGQVDVTRGSDFVTISWNRFSNHDKVSLVGASDGATGDRGRLHVTYHHNWFEGTNQRHPRVRYGQVHVFNNYYDNINAGIGIGVEAQIYSENNFFSGARTPYHYQDNSSQSGYMKDSGSIFGTSVPTLISDGISWSPSNHYNYTTDNTTDVPTIVMTFAGVGIIDGTVEPGEPSPEPGTPRESVGLIAHYPLTEGSGGVANDQSAFGAPLSLTLSGATWLNGGGISFSGGEDKLISTGSTAKLTEQISGTGQFSLEVLAKPGHLNQPDTGSHPSRIVTLSLDGSNRNFMLGHGGEGYQGPELAVRVRTTGNDDDLNGMPNIVASGEIAMERSHYVVTFDGSMVRIYRDGELKHSQPRQGELTNWESNYSLVLGNETNGNRGWVGELYEVSIFDRALSGSEIQDRFTGQDPDAGDPGAVTSFSNWLLATYPDIDLSDSSQTDPTADPYGSGIPNLLRYALGADTNGAGTKSIYHVDVRPNPTSGKDYLTIDYKRRKGATDTLVVVEVSTDLQNWVPLSGDSVLNVVPHGDFETVTVRDSVPVSEPSQRFMRIRVKLEESKET